MPTAETLRERLNEIKAEVSQAINDGARIIVLSDRDGDSENAPIPSLLLTSAVHHHLIREKLVLRLVSLSKLVTCERFTMLLF